MRQRALILVVVLSACATSRSAGHGRLEISPEGDSVTAGGKSWRAPPDASFFERAGVLHVVSSASPGYDVAVPLGPDGTPAWPADAPFEAVDGALRPRVHTLGVLPSVEALLASGQLHEHEDHLHLTHLFANPDWQALYADREESSKLHPMRRATAATLVAMMVDERIPGSPPDATRAALERAVSIMGKLRRGVEGGLGGPTLEAVMDHDVEIRDGGKTIEVEGRTYRAGAGVRFTWDGGHFHVESEAGRWAHPVFLPDSGPFEFPPSIFYAVASDGLVAERQGNSRWRRLADSGEVHFVRDHWHLDSSYRNPNLQKLLAAMNDPKLDQARQERARGLALELLRLRLDLGSDAEFEARLSTIDQLIDRSAAEFAREGNASPASLPARR